MKKPVKVLSLFLAIIAVFSVGAVVTYNHFSAQVEVAQVAVIKQGQRGDTVKTIQQKYKGLC